MDIKKNGFIHVNNRLAEAYVSLWGGNVVSYRPKTEKHDVFWLGERNKFDNIQAVRGGIPVCWPRFAEEKLNGNLPRHGFARLSNWALKSVESDEFKTDIELSLIPDEKYNVPVTAELFIRITDKLECSLVTKNHGADVFNFSEALHAYFNISSINDIEIKGLDGHRYCSSLDGKSYTLEKNLKINGEFDAAFTQHQGGIEIIDPAFNRIISIEKAGSNTTVVWNPNKDLAEMSEGQYKHFVCIEPANQGSSFVSLQSGGEHRMTMTVAVKNCGNA